VVARHQRAIGKGVKVLDLDHYLEILLRKPGALPGATALAQARAAGVFTSAHEGFWAAARKALGDSAGTRVLVEVLLLHRHLEHADVLAGITAALTVGRSAPTSSRSRPARPPSGVVSNRRRSRPHRAGSRSSASPPAGWSNCPAMTGHCPRSTPMTTCSERPAHERIAFHPPGCDRARRDRAIDSGTRVLRLPTIRDRFEETAAAAQREQLSYLGFLAELVMAECDDRDRRRAARRIHDAGFPRDKRIEEFSFDANPR
jgi:signal transduction histidine kinase